MFRTLLLFFIGLSCTAQAQFSNAEPFIRKMREHLVSQGNTLLVDEDVYINGAFTKSYTASASGTFSFVLISPTLGSSVTGYLTINGKDKRLYFERTSGNKSHSYLHLTVPSNPGMTYTLHFNRSEGYPHSRLMIGRH